MGNSRIYRKRRSGWYPDRRSTPRLLERDPSKTDDGIPGSDPVLWKNLCMAAGRDLGELSGTYRRMAGGKSRTPGRGISGLRGAGDDAFPCVRVCGTGRFPSCTGTGTAGADFLGDRGVAGRNLTVAGRKAIGNGDGWSAAGTGSF